jgi:uncharacterized glyoxalase superfamily protein PhnB
MSENMPRPSVGPTLVYKDPKAAIEWLERAFGFETSVLVTDSHGNVGHSELRFGNGYIMVAGEWAASERRGKATGKSPLSLDGANTASVHLQMPAGIDAHCERARAAGATIAQEPTDQVYGDRVYIAIDREGHIWSFGQAVRAVTKEEMEAASGHKIRMS